MDDWEERAKASHEAALALIERQKEQIATYLANAPTHAAGAAAAPMAAQAMVDEVARFDKAHAQDRADRRRDLLVKVAASFLADRTTGATGIAAREKARKEAIEDARWLIAEAEKPVPGAAV